MAYRPRLPLMSRRTRGWHNVPAVWQYPRKIVRFGQLELLEDGRILRYYGKTDMHGQPMFEAILPPCISRYPCRLCGCHTRKITYPYNHTSYITVSCAMCGTEWDDATNYQAAQTNKPRGCYRDLIPEDIIYYQDPATLSRPQEARRNRSHIRLRNAALERHRGNARLGRHAVLRERSYMQQAYTPDDYGAEFGIERNQ